MTAAIQTNLQQHPAFRGISTDGLSTLIANAEKVEFKIGQALSIGNSVPNRILLITRGRARLLGNQNGRVHTLALLGESSIIGLASLLRAEGCEEASASTSIEALAIPASTILDLWESEEFFRNWCNQTLFPAEAAAILEKISEKSEGVPFQTKNILAKCLPILRLITYSNGLNINIDKEEDIYICSSNSDKTLGSVFNTQDPPNGRGPFPIRLIRFPKN